MVTLSKNTMVGGVDPHLDHCTIAAIDPATGETTAQTLIANLDDGWKTAVGFCQRHRIETIGVESASSYGMALSRELSRAGITVIEVPTRLTARMRRLDGASKTDPGDAIAVARAVITHNLSPWCDSPEAEALRVLVHRREALINIQTREINQLRALLTEIDPGYAAQLKRVRTLKAFRELSTLDYHDDIYQRTVTDQIQAIAHTCHDRLKRIKQLQGDIASALPPAALRLIDQIHGCGVITAGILFAELAGTSGFDTDAKFAAWAGISPLDASSGRQQHHRLNRGGNRQANRAIHTIVITQIRQHGPAAHYLNATLTGTPEQRQAQKKRLIRAVKRHVARQVWKIINTTT